MNVEIRIPLILINIEGGKSKKESYNYEKVFKNKDSRQHTITLQPTLDMWHKARIRQRDRNRIRVGLGLVLIYGVVWRRWALQRQDEDKAPSDQSNATYSPALT